MTIAERVKLMPRKKEKTGNQNCKSKEAVNQTSTIVTSNKCWK